MLGHDQMSEDFNGFVAVKLSGGKEMDENKIQLFEDKRIRTAWDEENEEWYFSIVDVVGILTEQPTPRGATLYWG